MFLRSVRLENVRSLAQLELDLEAGGRWTLLLGENGTGKSTVLRAIALVMAGTNALPELLGNPDTWIRNGAKVATINVELQTADGKRRPVGLVLRRGAGISRTIVENAQSLAELDAALAKAARNYLTVGYGASRRLNAASETRGSKMIPGRSLHDRAASVMTLFAADASLNPLDTWAMDLHYRRHAAGLKIVERALNRILPNVRFSRIDRDRRELLFKTPDGVVPLRQLSDGYQNMAAWCGDLLFRITEAYQNYKNPFAARALLLVDEIDLHLHPTWQRSLRHFLEDRFPQLQVIATTHSALTAQQAKEGELHALLRRGAVIEHEVFRGDPSKLMAHQLLLDPIFRIGTLDSFEIETKKDRHDELRAKKTKTAKDKKELRELEEELLTVPEWKGYSEGQRKQIALLDSLKAAVDKLPKAKRAS